MLKFLSFGSGSSGNCYLLESSEESILIDAGVGYRKVKKYFSEYGVNQEKISAKILNPRPHRPYFRRFGTRHIP